MTNPKNHHYVPQSYLRRFSTDGSQIYVFDKFKQHQFVTNIKNVASETHFYNLSEEQIVELIEEIRKRPTEFASDDEIQEAIQFIKALGSVEQQLSIIEGQLDKKLGDLIALVEKNAKWFSVPPVIKSLKDVSPDDPIGLERIMRSGYVDKEYKQDIAFLVALQYIRTREYRNSLVEFYTKSTKALSTLFLRMKGYDTSKINVTLNVTPESSQMFHLGHMYRNDFFLGIVEALMNHMWTFVANETSQPLFTSDSPVALVPHKFSPHRSYAGFAAEGIEIRMPLSSKYAVVFYERTYFAGFQWLEGKVMPLNDDNVTYNNSVQINQSYRQVYSQTDTFELAERTCREHPEVCTPDRSYWNIE